MASPSLLIHQTSPQSDDGEDDDKETLEQCNEELRLWRVCGVSATRMNNSAAELRHKEC